MAIISRKQGELDGLCGIYSVANAIMLLTDIEPEESFNFALESLFKDKEPMSVVNGFEIGTLRDILSRTIKYLNSGAADLEDEETGKEYIPRLSFKMPFWQAETDRSIFQKTVMKVGKPDVVAIIGYTHSNGNPDDYYAHWTVIKNVTKSNLMTFDSSHESSRISWDRILLTSNNTCLSKHVKRPFLVRPRDFILLTNNKS